MLRSNSKKAVENIHNYIMDNFDGSNYSIETPDSYKDTAKIIFDTFKAEHFTESLQRYYRFNMWASFRDWAAGLPSILDTCYFYNRSAVDDLGKILEESEAEKARFTEAEAEEELTRLIFCELRKLD